MNIYLIIILALMLFSWLFSLIVELLNLKNFSLIVPNEFSDLYDTEKYSKNQQYLREGVIFGEIKKFIILIVTISFILLGGFAWIDNLARSVSEIMIIRGLTFAGIFIGLGMLANLPFELYNTFVIEEKYGFNKTTIRTFIMDRIKGIFLIIVIGGLIFSLILWFFDSVNFAWLWSWASFSVIQIFLYFIAPVVLMPLFNKFTPLEDGELKQAISNYALNQKYSIKGTFSIDGSKRSSKPNAFFTGFGKTKRIALFDTMIEKLNTDELVVAFAHEVGHSKLGHAKIQLVISLLSSLLMFFMLSLFITEPNLFAAFQIQDTPIYAGFFLFFFIYGPVEMIISMFTNYISRKLEFQADAFAAKTTNKPSDLINVLKKLSVEYLDTLTPHPLKVFLDYNHPPELERIKALREI